MKHNLRKISAGFSTVLIASAILTGCASKDFHIKGEIEGANGKTVVLEKSDFHGQWVVMDSTHTKKKGDFAFSMESPGAPEIYRLVFDGKYIYVPIDSTETITVKTTAADFGTDFSLEGSDKAGVMERFEKDINRLPAGISTDSLDNFKKEVYTRYMKDGRGSVVSYYMLTKIINGRPLFDPANDKDAKYFAAVATGFKSLRPDDPRTAILEQTSLNAMKRRNSNLGKVREVEANEVSFINIELPDEKGNIRKLSELTTNGKPTVLIFSLLTMPESPAINLALSKIYSAHNGNIDFYNVSLDNDQYNWREAASNLPWITVFDPDGEYSESARIYNVSALPTFFIYNSHGELSSRAADTDDLRKQLQNVK